LKINFYFNNKMFQNPFKRKGLFYLLYNMLQSQWPVVFIIVFGMVASVWLQKLTVAGALTGGIIGFAIFGATGNTGLLLMSLFFIMGTAATAWRKSEKIKEGLAEQNECKRTAAQVAANAGVAGLLALIILLQNDESLVYHLMIAAVFAAATSDTLSSELGNVYGKRFYNIITFKKDKRGLNGVISLEGTAAGLAGSSIIASLFILGYGWNAAVFSIIVVAGTIGNICDSLLGATLERKGRLNNNAVNFLNTALAALAAYLLYWLL
jgi:uncharacterized protein (TIGR00297 family)